MCRERLPKGSPSFPIEPRSKSSSRLSLRLEPATFRMLAADRPSMRERSARIRALR